MSQTPQPLHDFETKSGIYFDDKDLLQRAFVHRSFLNEAGEDFEGKDNERLEFLGDSVLGFVASEMLFARYPGRREGELTNLRAALVRRETLARFARRMEMGTFLLLGHGEEEGGGRTRPATLCATFEAVMGALYLDQGIERVREVVLPLFKKEIERVVERALAKDPKSRLQEWVQNTLGTTPRYKTVSADGPDHARYFTIQVTADRHPYGVGRGRSKQEASQSAAAMALHRLGQEAPEYREDPELETEFPLPPIEIST